MPFMRALPLPNDIPFLINEHLNKLPYAHKYKSTQQQQPHRDVLSRFLLCLSSEHHDKYLVININDARPGNGERPNHPKKLLRQFARMCTHPNSAP